MDRLLRSRDRAVSGLPTVADIVIKILHVLPVYFPAVRYGGPIYSVHGLAAGQAALGHQVSVLTTNTDGPDISDVPIETVVDLDGVEVTYFEVTTPRRLFRAKRMRRALAARAAEVDIVHLHAVFLWPTLIGARAARKAGTPFVLSPRGMLVAELFRAKSSLVKNLWLALFDRRTIREAAAIHFTADREAVDFDAMGLQAARRIVIPNGVEEPRATPEPISPDVAAATAQPGYALYLGRLNWKKNLVALIEAMMALPDLRLVIAGTDDELHALELQAAIDSARLTERIAMIARNVEGTDKERLFADCALFVLPSLNENFGNTVLEAMIRAKPVVVSSGAGVAAVVHDADCGIVAAPTAAALGQAIAEIAGDRAKAAALGDRGRQAALDHFGWRAIAARMVDAYRDLV